MQPAPDLLIAQALNQAVVGDKKGIPVWNQALCAAGSNFWRFGCMKARFRPADKRGIKLLQSFPEGSQPGRIADTVPTEVLLSVRGYSAILSEASGPQAIDKFLCEGDRAKNESSAAAIAAKELARQEMEAQLGEQVTDRLCGRILLKQANLSDVQREMIMLRGPALRTFDEVAALLRLLDRHEMLAKGQENTSTKHFFAEEVEDREYDESEAMAVYAYHSAYIDVRREL